MCYSLLFKIFYFFSFFLFSECKHWHQDTIIPEQITNLLYCHHLIISSPEVKACCHGNRQGHVIRAMRLSLYPLSCEVTLSNNALLKTRLTSHSYVWTHTHSFFFCVSVKCLLDRHTNFFSRMIMMANVQHEPFYYCRKIIDMCERHVFLTLLMDSSQHHFITPHIHPILTPQTHPHTHTNPTFPNEPCWPINYSHSR